MAYGSGQSFEAFLAEHERALLRTAMLLVGHREVGEDLLQDVLLRACRHWGRIDDPDAYLRQALVNASRSRWRRRRFREEALDAVAEPAVYGDAERVPVREALLTALRSLPPRQRSVLVLRYFEDLTEIQTADVLGCSPSTVKTHAARGLARMRAFLDLDLAYSNPTGSNRTGSDPTDTDTTAWTTQRGSR